MVQGYRQEKVTVDEVAVLPPDRVAVTRAVPAAARLTVVAACPLLDVVALAGVTVAPESVVNDTLSP